LKSNLRDKRVDLAERFCFGGGVHPLHILQKRQENALLQIAGRGAADATMHCAKCFDSTRRASNKGTRAHLQTLPHAIDQIGDVKAREREVRHHVIVHPCQHQGPD
jgi:hypothetical protein